MAAESQDQPCGRKRTGQKQARGILAGFFTRHNSLNAVQAVGQEYKRRIIRLPQPDKLREHYLKGCFDVPVYKTHEEAMRR